jgi:two-component system LytT family response regulator
MKSMRVVILDDEKDAIELLQLKLKKLFPELGMIEAYQKPKEALEILQVNPPDLLFIDIKMPGMNGFDFLAELMPISFSVIFITAYEQYALKAFRFNALDYLTKPFEDDDLKHAFQKAARQYKLQKSQLTAARQYLSNGQVEKIAISTQNGVNFLELCDIIYAESNNNYSKIYLNDKKEFIVSKTLKDLQDVLEGSHFMRIHRQYIVNLHHIRHFSKGESELTLTGNVLLPVARTLKDKLLEMFRSL